ncbi:YcaO-like family protein [Frankia sp. AgB1.9]|uniref:YcaO-like family protein n=1 Tax=unclassified Frankia TaxID=2632575 RepID=UPI0019336F7F|nr:MULTISPECIES: YcaO-like family protein [unclassified Frankia]MBL7493701.1 YcaO-like family protein [Frankia sp. AgW1.1]MBL7553014.1 YcaO-like family protein [Frankia sp. AgB1.9]MBL7621594.1 YcaO-like family protein [Frankia sp. AgB1.8]
MTMDDLVDRRLGLLTAVVDQPPMPGTPSGWLGRSSRVGRTDRFASRRADGFGFGATLADAGRARGAAIGEAVERYCGNAVPPDLPRASWDTLRARGLAATDPLSFALYSPRQYATPGFPFVPFTRDLEVAWVDGTDLASGAAVLVPASLVYLDYFHGPRRGEPPVNALMYSGIAAGTSLLDAETAALEEVFERDATTIWWASGAPARSVLDGGVVTGQLGRPYRDHPLTVRLLAVPSELDVPVLGAVLTDETDGILAFGAACRADPSAAAAKALVEALQLLVLGRQLADPGSDVWRSVAAGDIEGHVFLPFRADRRYGQAVSADYRELVDLPAIAQLYLDPALQRRAIDRLRPRGTVTLDALPRIDGPVPSVREAHLERLRARGLRAVAVDLTTADVARCGLHVVRVVVPGLIGNGPPAYPLRGGRRLYDVPASMGWSAAPLTEDDLVREPLPLA